MKLSSADVHALTIIAMDPKGAMAKNLIKTLHGPARDVARGLMDERVVSSLNVDVQSAVAALSHWAKPQLDQVAA